MCGLLLIAGCIGLLSILGNNPKIAAAEAESDSYAGLIFTLINDDTEYSVSNDPEVTVFENLVLPSFYNGKKVTKVDDYAFMGCEIQKLTFPSGWTSENLGTYNIIGKFAFSSVTELKSLSFYYDSSLAIPRCYFDEYSFSNCEDLVSISLDHAELNATAFSGVNLTGFGASFSRISTNMFSNLSSLSSIRIESSYIGENSFSNCKNILNINSYNCSLTANSFTNSASKHSVIHYSSVGKGAFNGFKSTELLRLTETNIAENAFNNCDLVFLELRGFAPSTKSYPVGANAFNNSNIEILKISEILVIDNTAFQYCNNKILEIIKSPLPIISSSIEELTLENVSISDNSFNNYTNLTKLTMSNMNFSVGAFTGCHNLKSVKLANVSGITNAIFTDIQVENLTIENCSLNNGFYSGKNSLKYVEIGNCIIPEGAFEYCENLTTVSLKNLPIPGNNAFDNCNNLETLNVTQVTALNFHMEFGKEIKYLSITDSEITLFSSFYTNLITLEINNCHIPSSAFTWCELDSLRLINIKSVSTTAFNNATIQSVYIKGGVISSSAFQNNNIVNLQIEKSIIQENCFYSIKGLKNLTLIESTFNGYSFKNCNLNTLTLYSDPKTVHENIFYESSIDELIAERAAIRNSFNDCAINFLSTDNFSLISKSFNNCAILDLSINNYVSNSFNNTNINNIFVNYYSYNSFSNSIIDNLYLTNEATSFEPSLDFENSQIQNMFISGNTEIQQSNFTNCQVENLFISGILNINDNAFTGSSIERLVIGREFYDIYNESNTCPDDYTSVEIKDSAFSYSHIQELFVNDIIRFEGNAFEQANVDLAFFSYADIYTAPAYMSISYLYIMDSILYGNNFSNLFNLEYLTLSRTTFEDLFSDSNDLLEKSSAFEECNLLSLNIRTDSYKYSNLFNNSIIGDMSVQSRHLISSFNNCEIDYGLFTFGQKFEHDNICEIKIDEEGLNINLLSSFNNSSLDTIAFVAETINIENEREIDESFYDCEIENMYIMGKAYIGINTFYNSSIGNMFIGNKFCEQLMLGDYLTWIVTELDAEEYSFYNSAIDGFYASGTINISKDAFINTITSAVFANANIISAPSNCFTSLTFSDDVIIGSNLFEYSYTIETIEALNCTSLNIGSAAFSSCSNLKTLFGRYYWGSQEDLVLNIGAFAFSHSNNLVEVNIRSSSQNTIINTNAFGSCNSLDVIFTNNDAIAITLRNKLSTNFKNLILPRYYQFALDYNGATDKNGTDFMAISCSYINYCIIMDDYLPQPTKTNSVFLGWYNGALQIADNFGELCYAWGELSDMSLIAEWSKEESEPIPDYLEFVEIYNYNLTEIIGYEVKKAVNNISGEIYIPSTFNGKPVIRIATNGFYGCTNATAVIIPNTVTEIGNNAFYGCTSLQNVAFTLDCELQTIGEYAFSQCLALTEINIPSLHLETIKLGAFAGSGLSVITLTKNAFDGIITLIENATVKVFPNCLTSIFVADHFSVDEYKEAWPANYYSLIKTNSNNNRDILECDPQNGEASAYLFVYVNEYYRLGVPERAGYIFKGWYTQANENGVLYADALGKSVNKWGDYSIVSKLYAKWEIDTSKLAFILLQDGTYEVGRATQSVGGTIVIPEMYNGKLVTKIADNAFTNCANLLSITIPKSIATIGFQAFKNCTSLEEVIFEPASCLSFMDQQAFMGCSALKTITIPNTFKSFVSGTFRDCVALESIYLLSEDTVVTLAANVFLNCNNIKFYVPAQLVSTYRTTAGWKVNATLIYAIPTP